MEAQFAKRATTPHLAPRKRPRTDSAIDIGGYSDTDCFGSAVPVVDDPVFFRDDPDADLIVRVTSTRFKVKRSLLSDASPVLEDILAKLGPDTALVLTATDADEFRALLWALYATPQEIAAQPREHEDVDRLILIASISRQYRCRILENWVKDVILRTVSTDPVFIASCSSAMFKRLIDCAVRTRNDALLESTIAQWTARIRRREAPCVPAILTADAYELPRLRGVAYYFHIQDMIDQQTTVNGRGATQFQTDPKLSNAQVMCLLSGHWSLVSVWERLRRIPPKFECTSGCGKRCAVVFGERWAAATISEKVNGTNSASVLALLGAMRDQLAMDKELTKSIPPQCKLAALQAVNTQVIIFEDGLVDHFFGCL
ncbi:hypothetical protein MSAN_01773200 [Mycena sanguinolenta]|uniref:BTB domain-containing protein n=1 Tax=Mycena sanguinolenta TaxID=230812 RepID=A0A8H6XXH3_9AGAR|nr:hypothetical protein MSAN_01773200 [Mycena sanguinolenta]